MPLFWMQIQTEIETNEQKNIRLSFVCLLECGVCVLHIWICSNLNFSRMFQIAIWFPQIEKETFFCPKSASIKQSSVN